MTVRSTLTKGGIAGVLATAAMDAVCIAATGLAAAKQSPAAWEFSGSTTGFGPDAPAPARVGKLLADKLGVNLPDRAAPMTNNVVHWMTGLSWGTGAAIAARLSPARALVVGPATGIGAWATSYAVLGRLGIYKPITQYDRRTLWQDFSAHLVFGATLGAALGVLRAGRR